MPKVTWTGDASSAERANAAVAAGMKRIKEEAGNAVKSAERLNREAQRIKESVDPFAKLERQTRELTGHLNRGAISLQDFNLKLKEYRREAEAAGQSGHGAFRDQLPGIAAMARGIGGLMGPLALATKGFQDLKQAADSARGVSAESRIDIGSLRQLAGSNDEFQGLKAKAEALFAAGAVKSLPEGAQSVFALKSAGLLSDEAFQLFSALGEKGVIGDIPGLARGTTQYSSAFGAQEAGTAKQIVSKAFAAAKYSPASVEQLLSTQPRVGAIAAAQGLTDEETFATTAVLSASVGAETASTLTTQFLASTAKLKGFEGLDITERVEKLKALKLSQPELQKKLGSVEAATGFSLAANNLASIYSAEKDLIAANTDPAAVARRLKYVDPESDAALSRQRIQNRSILQSRREGAFEDIRVGDFERRRQELREYGRSGPIARAQAAWELGLSHIEEFISGYAISPETYVNNQSGPLGGGLNRDQQAVVDVLNRTAVATEQSLQEIKSLRQQQRSRVTTRPE